MCAAVHQHGLRYPHPGVTGVVLAGGEGRRLGRDKTSLRLPGQSLDLLQKTVDLLRQVTADVRVSCRADQPDRAARAGVPQLEDIYPGGGALRAVCSVLRQVNRPCLIIACDLPFLNAEVLRILLERRESRPPHTLLTAWRQKENGLVQSLTAVYEPGCLPLLEAAIKADLWRLNHVIPEVHRLYVDFAEEQSAPFWNVNHLQDWEEAIKNRNLTPSDSPE